MTKLQFLKLIITVGILVSAGGIVEPDSALASSTASRSITSRLKLIRERMNQRSHLSSKQEIHESEPGHTSETISQFYWPNWGNWPNWNNWRNWMNWGNWGNY